MKFRASVVLELAAPAGIEMSKIALALVKTLFGLVTWTKVFVVVVVVVAVNLLVLAVVVVVVVVLVVVLVVGNLTGKVLVAVVRAVDLVEIVGFGKRIA